MSRPVPKRYRKMKLPKGALKDCPNCGARYLGDRCLAKCQPISTEAE